MLEAYEEYFEAAERQPLRPGETSHDVHCAVRKALTDRDYHSATSPEDSIGMTMIEHPKIGPKPSRPSCARTWCSRCTRMSSPTTDRLVSTCRTPLTATAVSRSRACRCGSTRPAKPGPDPFSRLRRECGRHTLIEPSTVVAGPTAMISASMERRLGGRATRCRDPPGRRSGSSADSSTPASSRRSRRRS